MRTTLFFLALLFCALLIFSAYSEKSPYGFPIEKSEYIRFIDTGEHQGRLESAIVSFEKADGCRVDLIAALHLGDPVYYDTLELFFQAYDALLYELIAPKDIDWTRVERDGSILGIFQRKLCRAMDLEFQLDAIDYGRPNFVHADMTDTEFFKRWEERGESIWKILMQAMTAQARAVADGVEVEMTPEDLLEAVFSKDSAERLKFLLAREFQDIEKLLAYMDKGEDGEESLLLGERNRAAIEALEEQLDLGLKKLGLFYGAGHMPDLELRLQRDLGFRKTGQEWFTAWEIGSK